MRAVAWGERHQVPLYLGAIAVGALVGLAVPDAAALGPAITPLLAALLFATFLGVPFARIGRAVRDVRFLAVLLGTNFVVLPVIVFLLSRPVSHDAGLLAGVLLVLLTPCVDYVLVFSGLAGGDRDRLVAATPLLLIAQMLLLPGYLWLMAGPTVAGVVDPGPFVEAFLLLVALPLALAVVTQLLSRRIAAFRGLTAAATALMVPLMMAVLFVVLASQVPAVGGAVGALLPVVPLFVAFVVVAVPVSAGAARLARLDRPGRIAATFSGATRNSLVVLPLALALPAPFALAPLAVVTQTLVELVAMVVLTAVLPRVIRGR